MEGQQETSTLTIAELAKLITKGNDKLSEQMKTVESKLDGLSNRVDRVEVEVAKVNEIQEKHANEIAEIQNQQVQQHRFNANTEETIARLEERCDRLEETNERQWRANNIIIHGIKEDRNDMDTVRQILSIIYYGKHAKGIIVRVGIERHNKVRPFRVKLGNSDDVYQALVKSNKLKDYEQYRGIYVTRDETQQQQAISRMKRQ